MNPEFLSSLDEDKDFDNEVGNWGDYDEKTDSIDHPTQEPNENKLDDDDNQYSNNNQYSNDDTKSDDNDSDTLGLVPLSSDMQKALVHSYTFEHELAAHNNLDFIGSLYSDEFLTIVEGLETRIHGCDDYVRFIGEIIWCFIVKKCSTCHNITFGRYYDCVNCDFVNCGSCEKERKIYSQFCAICGGHICDDCDIKYMSRICEFCDDRLEYQYPSNRMECSIKEFDSEIDLTAGGCYVYGYDPNFDYDDYFNPIPNYNGLILVNPFDKNTMIVELPYTCIKPIFYEIDGILDLFEYNNMQCDVFQHIGFIFIVFKSLDVIVFRKM